MSTPLNCDVPSPDELRESVAAVQEAVADMEAGDSGRPAQEVIGDLRQKHQV